MYRGFCIKIALKDLVFRGLFRLPVPEEEIKLMNELIASDENLRKIVNDYKKNLIELQDHFIEFGDYKMTSFDFIMLVFDDKKVKFLARNENLWVAVYMEIFPRHMYSGNFSPFRIHYDQIRIRIEDIEERLRHLKNLKKISSLRKAIPLPFELFQTVKIAISNTIGMPNLHKVTVTEDLPKFRLPNLGVAWNNYGRPKFDILLVCLTCMNSRLPKICLSLGCQTWAELEKTTAVPNFGLPIVQLIWRKLGLPKFGKPNLPRIDCSAMPHKISRRAISHLS
ncbi:Protein of unknown function [Cotesia congregata]|uniref:Uncharacterized protein n=1 Tax=Cotesia congregata TaxID=51543 RepID=A0A8J2MDA1_COTCN|nr:Protein of unknown function [Cotesia congregata]